MTDYLDGVLPSDWRAGVENHLAGCTGCTEHLRQIRLTIQALRALTATGSPQQAYDRTAR